ncbi:Zn-dependent protease with chaperone function [Clostridium tetanomorphum]|uniref:M48 family metallopeptidase n=1 Tax=Clostridium tetanomorphum TaxID=1553 RepID=UPI00044EC5BD|nr:M48 family metallopeptidase [Clostridium tetanomorphum]KAJ51789.1 Zn-dependent protease with chaperone function [Clostridium tetanomorphum DSM 665]MBP1865024.1 Zn-dependent protease with chaperone function [Clostridium tetanomorphum]NRS83378.1 Zn-dependent protease with chaperone function [Clostridium tetanomorphum]SQC01439.1 Zn-dependent protease with chaperone function [Clostridium tetanomorphum]
MKKRLTLLLTIFFAFIFLFIISVRIAENKNTKELQSDTSYTIYLENDTVANFPKTSDKSISYRKANINIWSINLILTFAIPILFLTTGFSIKIKSIAENISSHLILQIAIYFIIFTTINCLITLPLDYYSSFINKHNFGLSNQSSLKWFSDYFKSFSLSMIIGAIFIWIPYFIIKASPKKWWLYLGVLSIPVLLFTTFISPRYIDPLFNKYTAIENKNLEKKIYEQLEKVGLENSNLYQVDKSVDTKEMNAYMTGVFSSKRIVLWDTTINKLSENETLAVTAHEIGHYVMGHVWKSIVLGGLFTILILYLVNKTALWIIFNFGKNLGFDKLYDIAALPLIILLMNFFIFLGNPVINTYSRYVERQADTFQLELTKDTNSAITSTIKLHENSLALPHPSKIYEIWYYTHPSYYDRIKFATEYMPWKENKPLKYGKYIKK